MHLDHTGKNETKLVEVTRWVNASRHEWRFAQVSCKWMKIGHVEKEKRCKLGKMM